MPEKSAAERNLDTTRDVYEKLFFAHATPQSAELLADSRFAFHMAEYQRVLGVPLEAFRGRALLETGCGPGSHSLILSKMLGPEGRLVSFDLSPGNVEKATAMLATNGAPSNYRVMVSSAETFAIDDTFDFVFSHNWLHHSEDDLRSLFNIVKPLKTGGTFYLCTYQARTFRALICELVRRESLAFDRQAFLELVPFVFPGGFSRYNFFQIIHYENLIDDYLVPNVRFGHLDTIAPAFARAGLSLRDAGVSRLLLRPELFDIEDVPLKAGFTKTRHFDRFEDFRDAIGGPIFTESVPHLPAEAAHIPALAREAYASLGSPERRMLLSLALHGLRCDYATASDNAAARFASITRLLTSVIARDNAAYSIHAPDVWATREHPLARQIVETTPNTSERA